MNSTSVSPRSPLPLSEKPTPYVPSIPVPDTSLIPGAQVHPVAAVEVELSLFALEEEVKDVLEACDDLGIALVAYSYVLFPSSFTSFR